MDKIKQFKRDKPFWFWFWFAVVTGCISPRAFVVLCIAIVVCETYEDNK